MNFKVLAIGLSAFSIAISVGNLIWLLHCNRKNKF